MVAFRCLEVKMKICSRLPRKSLFIFLILCAAVVRAHAGRPLEFSLLPGAGTVTDPFAGRNFAGSSQDLRPTAGYGPGLGGAVFLSIKLEKGSSTC